MPLSISVLLVVLRVVAKRERPTPRRGHPAVGEAGATTSVSGGRPLPRRGFDIVGDTGVGADVGRTPLCRGLSVGWSSVQAQQDGKATAPLIDIGGGWARSRHGPAVAGLVVGVGSSPHEVTPGCAAS